MSPSKIVFNLKAAGISTEGMEIRDSEVKVEAGWTVAFANQVSKILNFTSRRVTTYGAIILRAEGGVYCL